MPPRSVQRAKEMQMKLTSMSPSRKKMVTERLWSDLSLIEAKDALGQQNYDVELVCGDLLSVFCHQTVLAAASSFLRNILHSVSLKSGDDSVRSSEMVTILLPDVSSKILSKCLNFLYHGFCLTSSTSKLEIKEFKNVFKNVLQIDIVKLTDRDLLESFHLKENMSLKPRDFAIARPKVELKEGNVSEDSSAMEENDDDVKYCEIVKMMDEEGTTMTPEPSQPHAEPQKTTISSVSENSKFGDLGKMMDDVTSLVTSSTKKKTQKHKQATLEEEVSVPSTSKTVDDDIVSKTPVPTRAMPATPSTLITPNSMSRTPVSTPSSRSSKATPTSSGTKRKKSTMESSMEELLGAKMKKAKEAPKKEIVDEESASINSKPCKDSILSKSDLQKKIEEKMAKDNEKTKKEIRMRMEPQPVEYKVEKIHCCVLCNGMKDGKEDKDAKNLSFGNLKKLKEHYSKHFYDEGLIFKHFPPAASNRNEDGSPKDQFGKVYKFKCEAKAKDGSVCWMSKRPGCGYKEISLHNCKEHGLFEKIVDGDPRPELQALIKEIEEECSDNPM